MPSPISPLSCLPSDRRVAPARAPGDSIWTSSAASRSCWRWAGISAARQRQPGARRTAVAGAHLRLGRRRPVLRPQRLPDGPARAARTGADRAVSTDGGSPRGACCGSGRCSTSSWPSTRSSAPNRWGPICGRTPSTCRTTRGRRWRTCGRSRSRSTSTSCWPSSSRCSPGAASRCACWSASSSASSSSRWRCGASVSRPGSARCNCSGGRTSAWTRSPPACCSPSSGCTHRRRSSASPCGAGSGPRPPPPVSVSSPPSARAARSGARWATRSRT